MNNNIIAIIAISFIVVGSLWGIGNIISQNNIQLSKGEGVLLLMKDNKFNVTNPDINVKVNQPLKISIANQDFRKHDFIVDELNVNTGFISNAILINNETSNICSINRNFMLDSLISLSLILLILKV